MKTNSHSITGRVALSALVILLGVGFAGLAFLPTPSQSARGKLARLAAPGIDIPTAGIPPAPQDSGPPIGYENFMPPGVLTPVTTTEAGQQVHSVEYLGRVTGEPSIGANFATGTIIYKAGLESLFVTFDNSCPANGATATWVNRASPTSVGLDSDPILFTDRGYTDALGFHSRTFGGELTFLSPDTVKLGYTDDDGMTWVPDQTGGLASAVDHETIGAGIYHTPVPARPPGTVYPYAVYYCSQDIAAALCSRSDNGGLTYGPSIAIYNLTQCGGVHGHIKVSPVDGTVYIPNLNCGGNESLVVSQDNGLTWTIRPTPFVNPGTSVGADPAIGIDANGRVYFLGTPSASVGQKAAVATSDDFGQTWQNIYDVGAAYGVKYADFPAAVAGDAGRAAVAFYGSATGSGDSSAIDFRGIWHLYIAHTFDGGAHWTTTDATPNAPMQRMGLLRGGTADIDRNLLDFFDITMDRDGRVLVGYVNGCDGGNCAQAASTATGNAYSTTATIARQSSGRRLLAAKDPVNPTSAPGMPSVTERRIGRTTYLSWSEADTGNSPITGYQILRGTASNGETLLTTVAGTQTGGSFTDLTATDITKTYYYKVIAVNAVGSSCPNNEIAAPYVGDGCSGIVIHKNDPTHPEANAGTATPASLLIDYIAVGEPSNMPDGTLMFKMKVNDLSTVPPNSRWRMMWDSIASSGEQYYIGMSTGPSGPPTFEYGELGDAGVPGIFVIGETPTGTPLTASNFQSDGTITIFAPKSAFGNPQVGDLLGAVGGRTFADNNPGQNVERSNAFIDHTFVKAQANNSYPSATYTLVGNATCEGGIVPISAVSRKTHDSITPPFDLDLPLSGSLGIECRKGQGANSDQHQVVVTFAAPIVGFSGATVSSGTGTVSSSIASGNQIFINLSGVANAQRLTITIHAVNDGTNVGDVNIPMGVLLGDTNNDGFVNSADIGQTKAQSGHTVTTSNFREDVNVDGFLNSADIGLVKSKSGTALP